MLLDYSTSKLNYTYEEQIEETEEKSHKSWDEPNAKGDDVFQDKVAGNKGEKSVCQAPGCKPTENWEDLNKTGEKNI